jgi:hypothetical protein
MSSDMQRELETIRKRLKVSRQRSIAAVVIALAASLALIAHTVVGMWLQHKGYLGGQYLVLTGPDGGVRAALDAREGESSLLLHDAAQVSGVGIRVKQDGTPQLRLSRDGEPRLDMSVPSDGGPFLRFNRTTGKTALACGAGRGDRSYLVLYDRNGEPRVLIRVDAEGSATIQIRDANGHVVWRAP